jgi:hypothetical protein
MDFMTKLRNVLIGAVAVVTSLALVAAPAGAAQSHPKYIRAIEGVTPSLNHYSPKRLVQAGEQTCSSFRQWGPDDIEGIVSGLGWQFDSFNARQLGTVMTGAVRYFCPSYWSAIVAYDDSPQAASGAHGNY